MTKMFEKHGDRTRMFVQLPAKGPWIVGNQYESRWDGISWADAVFMASREGLLTMTLDLSMGQVMYQQGPNGECEKVAYLVDCSD